MILTKNFNPNTDPKLLCTCGDSRCDRRSINQESLNKLQLIRNDYGKPIIVTSGGRCQYHPDELKSKAGDHQERFAVDVKCDTVLERNKLMVLAGRHGATRVAFGSNFVHISWTPTSDKSVPTWEY